MRVPNTGDKAPSNTSTNKDNNVLWNAIEKELLRQGFSVRDRGLFNEIINKTGSAAMKSTSYLWQNPNTGATNSGHFNGLPGGRNEGTGSNFDDINTNGYWWSSTEFDFT